MKNSTIITASVSTGALLLGLALGVVVAPTPAACEDAISSAETLHDISAQGFGLAGEALDYAVSWNAAGLERTTVELDKLATQTRTNMDAFEQAANKCDGGDR